MIGPYLIEINDVEIPRLSPEELEERMKSAIAAMHYVPLKEEEAEEVQNGKLKKLHTDVLMSFAREWWIPESRRCESLGNIHPEYFGRIVKDLQEMGLLGEKQYFGFGKGKPSITCFVTEKGAELLGIPYKEAVPPGKGSAAHRFLQKLMADKLKGVIEYGGADVVAYKPEGVAYEIELDPSDEHFLKNIERDLSIFPRVVVVARSQKEISALKSKAEDHFSPSTMEDIEFKTIKEVLENG